MQLQEALERYETQLAADGRSRHSTAQARRHVLALSRWLHAHGHDCDVQRVTADDIARFLSAPETRKRPDGRPRRTSTMNALRSSLRCFGAYLGRAGLVDLDPCRLVRLARASAPPPRGLSEADRRRLLAELDRASGPLELRDAALFKLLLLAGLRIGSALALDVDDLDLTAGEARLRTVKGGGEQVAILPDTVVEALRLHLGNRHEGAVFLGQHRRRLTARHAARRLRMCAQRAGIEGAVSPHRLRHTCGQRVLDLTGDLTVVQAALGHRSIRSSAVYARASSERVREVLGA